MKTKRYHNASQVLPPALLRQVQDYCTDMLYVPRVHNSSENNRLRALSMKAQGMRTGEIARRMHLTPRGVRKIIAKDRERAQALGPDISTENDVYRPCPNPHIPIIERGWLK